MYIDVFNCTYSSFGFYFGCCFPVGMQRQSATIRQRRYAEYWRKKKKTNRNTIIYITLYCVTKIKYICIVFKIIAFFIITLFALVYLMDGILLTCEQHHFTRDVWTHKTSVSPPLFIEVPVSGQKSERSFICMLWVLCEHNLVLQFQERLRICFLWLKHWDIKIVKLLLHVCMSNVQLIDRLDARCQNDRKCNSLTGMNQIVQLLSNKFMLSR